MKGKYEINVNNKQWAGGASMLESERRTNSGKLTENEITSWQLMCRGWKPFRLKPNTYMNCTNGYISTKLPF